MWHSLGQFILRHRILLLVALAGLTGWMGYEASQVQLSYEFTRAIPTDNPKYKSYQAFKSKFGEDGNVLVVGIQSDRFFQDSVFNAYAALCRNLKTIRGVEDVLSVPGAIGLYRDSAAEKLNAVPLFPERVSSQAELDSLKQLFANLPFYEGLLYNPKTKSYLAGLRINKDLLATKEREQVIQQIVDRVEAFGKEQKIEMHISGLPLIRTQVALMIQQEMKLFLIASVVLSALILLLFFRSVSAMVLSLMVVGIGVVWSVGLLHLLGYKISLLTALIPPLVVVIGIPNCIYFLNKYHVAFNETGHREKALVTMVEKMGIVTLFCNITAAIGFAVFALTESALLKEFGLVAGTNIFLLFFISLILIPAVLSFLPAPKTRHTRYLVNPRMNRWLDRLERWSLNHRRLVYGITIGIVLFSIGGMLRLRSEGFIVDDLPKTSKIYTDLKFFEKNFKGVMPLEIVVDTRKKQGVTRNLRNLENIDSLSQYLQSIPDIARPLSIAEGLKFARQAFFEGDPGSYALPSSYDLPAMMQYLNFRGDSATGKSYLAKLVGSFMDSTRSQARISVNMADIGSRRLPGLLDSVQNRAEELFNRDSLNALSADSSTKAARAGDTAWGKRTHAIELTGTSVTFLEGSRFIINGLKESIFWAFLLIAACMLYLFRSVRILLASLIPNLIPLVITAGVMGWVGVPLKPSTVLVFSVALGIAIDVTIRFLVNYKQELPNQGGDQLRTVVETIHHTGISILYTSMVLIAGFIVFCLSEFGGTLALGWLTSLTLVTATFTNLVLLPAILISLGRKPVK
ncbi:MAG: RND transporter [Bacteroidetes bacterium]|nr:RND transporter [Bacteroidota bacterium]